MEAENCVYGSMEILPVLRLVFLLLRANLISSVFLVNVITSGQLIGGIRGRNWSRLDREAYGGT